MLIDLGWFMRTVHVLAATAWVGGSIMYQFIVIPALRVAGPVPAISARIALLFKRLVNACVGILLVTGVYLMFDRLTQTTLGLPYLIVLGIKVIAALGLFVLVLYMAQSKLQRLAKRSTRLSKVAPQLMLALGICIFILGALLNHLFELAIAPR
jgi:uncharacterized membrane protein